jgi:membrane protein
MFSILKGLGVQYRLETILLEKLSAGSEELVSQLISYVDRTNVNTLGALGLVGLIVTAISVVGNVERALNHIWGVEQTRTLARKFSDYLSVLFTCPILMVAALGLTGSLQSTTFIRAVLQIPGMSQLMLVLAMLTPYVLVWAALTFVYVYLPNTKVRFGSALFGGLVAGTLLQIAQWVYIYFQVGVARYNAIYGAFAQLPIFLGWLYLGWLFFLLGAVMSFAHQADGDRQWGFGWGDIRYALKEELALKLLVVIARGFYSERDPWTAEALSREIGVPVPLVREILHQHCMAGILFPASRGGGEVYLLGKPPENLSIYHITEAMRNFGGDNIVLKSVEGDGTLRKTLDDIGESRRQALSRVTLKDLAM